MGQDPSADRRASDDVCRALWIAIHHPGRVERAVFSGTAARNRDARGMAGEPAPYAQEAWRRLRGHLSRALGR
jgi:hypothetical protein